MDTDDLITSLAIRVDARERRELANIAESWPYDTQQQQVDKLRRVLTSQKPPTMPQYNVYEVACLLSPSDSITSVTEVTFYAATRSLNKVFPRAAVTSVSPDAMIPAASLVILPLTLCHLSAVERGALLSVFREQARFGVMYFAVYEHTFDGSARQYSMLDITCNYLYARDGTSPRPLRPATMQQWEREFWQAGIALSKRTVSKNGKYWCLYQSSSVVLEIQTLQITGTERILAVRRKEPYSVLLQQRDNQRAWRVFSVADTVLLPDAPSMPYWEGTGDTVETPVVKWGQMKLFAETLQILTLWNWDAVPAPTVVYAGAAEGWNVEILASMYPTVTWHLYDWRAFNLKPNKMIHIHTGRYTGGDFTDETANSYLPHRHEILFLCDIRSNKEEKFVLQDMQSQARWVRLMQPRLSGLKFHPPYPVEGDTDAFAYLAGYVLLQAFNGKASSETRLMVTSEGAVSDDVMYSKRQYESQMFYHNMVIRSAPLYGPSVLYDDELSNHHDSMYLLYSLERWKMWSGSSLTPLEIAHDVIDALNARRKEPVSLRPAM